MGFPCARRWAGKKRKGFKRPSSGAGAPPASQPKHWRGHTGGSARLQQTCKGLYGMCLCGLRIRVIHSNVGLGAPSTDQGRGTEVQLFGGHMPRSAKAQPFGRRVQPLGVGDAMDFGSRALASFHPHHHCSMACLFAYTCGTSTSDFRPWPHHSRGYARIGNTFL